MTNTDNNGENNENQDQNESAADLYAQYRHLSNLQSNLTDVSQRANDAAAETNAERIRILARLRQQVLNNQSAMPQPLQIQIAAAIRENVDHQDGQQENDGPKEAHSQPNAPTAADGNAIGSGSLRHRQRDYPSTSLPQPFAQRNGNTGKIQQLASAPPTLSCNQQHRQQEQQQEEELHHSEAEVQPLSGPNVEVIQIEDEEEEVEQENAIMEVDGSADEQNEANENIEQCQEEMHSGHRMTGEEQRSNLAEWDIIRDHYIAEFCANVQNEVMPESNNNVENEHPMNAENGPMNVENDPMNEEGQEVPTENVHSRIEEIEPELLIEPPQIEAIQQINVEENEGEEEVEYQNHCECNGGNNQQEEENVPGNENGIGPNVGGNQRERMNNVQGRKLKGRNPGEDWCKCCLFQVLFGHSLLEYKSDPELQKKFAEFLNRRTLVPERDEQLIEEFAQYLRQREANAEAQGQPKDGNQQPTAGPSENDASNVQSTSAQIPVPMATANAGPSLNSSTSADGNDRKKLEVNRNIPKKPSKQKSATMANPPNGPSSSTTFDEILANMERMPSSSAGSNFNGRTLDQRLLQDVLPDSQPAQTNLASITEATLGQQQEQNDSTNEQMDANEAPQSPHPSNSDGIQQNVEMSKKKAKPSPISTVNGQQNSQPQQSATPQQQRNPPEQGIWMTSTSNFTPSPSNMADDVFEFPATSPPHAGNVATPSAIGNDQIPRNVVERTPLGAIHPNAPNKKRRSDSPRKGSGEKRGKKADKQAAGAAVLNPKYERIGGNGPRNVEILGNNGQQVGTTNEGNVGQQQSAAQHSSDAHPIASPPTPMSPNENVDHPSGTNPPKNVPKKNDCRKPTPRSKKGWKPTINPHGPLAKKLLGMDNAPAEQPAPAQRQNSTNGQANEDQMRQSTSHQNIQDNANSVKPPPNSPIVRQQQPSMAKISQQKNLAKKSAGTVAPQPAQAQCQNSANGPKIGANAHSAVQSPANAKPTTVRRQQAPIDPRLGYAPPVMAKNNVNGALAKKSEMNPPQRPAAVHRQRSVNGQTNEGQMYQSASLNTGINANPVQRRDPGPALLDQQLIVSAMNNPNGQLAKTMGDPGTIRSLLAKPHSHKNTENANGERRPTVPAPNQRQNVANNGQIRQSTSTRPSNTPSIRGQQSPPATGAKSNRQHQQKSPGDQRGTGGTKKLRFLFGTVTPADNGTPEANNGQSAGNKANGPKANGGGNGSSNGQGTSTSAGVNHGPTNQGGTEAKKGAAMAKSGQKPAPPPADDIIIPKSKFTDRSKPSAGGSRRNE